MRNEVLHGYMLHQSPFKEKSKLVRIFTLEHGRIDAILRGAAPPLFQSFRAVGNGKRTLKQLTQPELVGSNYLLQGRGNYAGLYLNELLYRLLSIESPQPVIFNAYIQALTHLSSLYVAPDKLSPLDENKELSKILRPFELTLLNELGYALQFDKDVEHNEIEGDKSYIYQNGQGFMPLKQVDVPGSFKIKGAILKNIDDARKRRELGEEELQLLNRICRIELNQLLGAQPLYSRQLWQASQIAKQ